MSCGFIDSAFALLLKIHLRFRGSFLRFHSMAIERVQALAADISRLALYAFAMYKAIGLSLHTCIVS